MPLHLFPLALPDYLILPVNAHFPLHLFPLALPHFLVLPSKHCGRELRWRRRRVPAVERKKIGGKKKWLVYRTAEYLKKVKAED